MTDTEEEQVRSCPCAVASDGRRGFLAGTVAAAAGVLLRGTPALSAAETAAAAPPQPGDLLTYQAAARRGPHLRPEDLKETARQVMALPVDPASGVVRDGSRHNAVLLTRFDPSALDAQTAARAADGVVAYSSICTHDACTVSSWDPKTLHYVCPCHQSRFDPRAGGVLVSGPAYRPLPALPLKLQDGLLVVAEAFTARVGGGR